MMTTTKVPIFGDLVDKTFKIQLSVVNSRLVVLTVGHVLRQAFIQRTVRILDHALNTGELTLIAS